MPENNARQIIGDLVKARLQTLGFYIFPCLLLGGMLTDAASVWLEHNGSAFWRLSLLLRSVFTFSSIAILPFVWRRSWNSYSLLLVGLIVATISLMVGYTIDPIFEFGEYVESILMMVKFLFFFVMYFLLKGVLRSNHQLRWLAKIADIVLFTYAASILLGALMGIPWLRAYPDYRPGYKGIIFAQNEATSFLLIAVAWFFLRVARGERPWPWLAAALLASICVGTKGLLIAVPVLMLGMSFVTYGARKTSRWAMIIVGFSALSGWLAYSFVESITATVDLFVSYLTYQLENFAGGATSTLLVSGRDFKVGHLLTLLIERFPWALFVGGGAVGGYMSESDPIDLAIAFGVPFLIYYLTALWHLFIGAWWPKTQTQRFLAVFSGVWFLIAFLGGHVWASGICAPFLALLIVYAKLESKSNVV